MPTPVAAAISLKLAPVEFVGDEHVALLGWQLGKRVLELVEQHAARELFFRPGVRRRQEIVEFQLLR